MSNNAGFQKSVNITPSGITSYYPGQMIGATNFNNPSQSAVVNKNSSIAQGIATFTFYAGANTCTPLFADATNGILLGFVANLNNTVWNDANMKQGWSLQVQQGYQLNYFATGTAAAVVPSLNNTGAGPILYGDIVLINKTTGALASQTSATIPSTHVQCITGGRAWKVINVTPQFDAEGNSLANLVVISNIQDII